MTSRKRGAWQPGIQTGESKVTVPVGSATSMIPEKASRIDHTKSWVVAVLSVDGTNWGDWMRGSQKALDLRFCDKAQGPRPKGLTEAGSGEGARGLRRVIWGSRGSSRGHDGRCLNLGLWHGVDERGRLIEPNQGRGASRGADKGGVAITKPNERRAAQGAGPMRGWELLALKGVERSQNPWGGGRRQ